MKLLIQWSSTLIIFLTTFLNVANLKNSNVLALPENQVAEKLSSIPVFSIYNQTGHGVVEVNNTELYFMNEQDAEITLANIYDENPELSGKLYVDFVPLAQIYKRKSKVNFVYVPNEEAVNSAKDLGEANQKPYSEGVPLFVMKAGEDFPTMRNDSNEIIPFFFSKPQLDELIARLQDENPELAENINIEVVSLENLIETLETEEDPVLEKIRLIPSDSALQYLRDKINN